MEVCLLAGKIMLKSGAETYRIEDTMNRIAQTYTVREVHSYVTNTGIFLSVDSLTGEQSLTKFLRIHERQINLNKIADVNEISRKITLGQLTIEEAHIALQNIEKAPLLYPFRLQLLAAALASGSFTLIFGGAFIDFLPSVIAGGVGFFLYSKFNRRSEVKFFAEVLASFTIGAIAYLFFFLGLEIHIDKVIIGSVMPLVPGVLITNAVRDLMAGDLLSGLARGAEAFFTAFAIGAGIAIILALLM
ncbi:MAG: threonine/serine exporter family protein [Desulfitobacterium sp.]|nr:threonine/serine exporter family protein [Desulfitobacterium sp.]